MILTMSYAYSWVIFRNEFTKRWEYIQTTPTTNAAAVITAQKNRFAYNRYLEGQEFAVVADSCGNYTEQKYIGPDPKYLREHVVWSTIGGPLRTTKPLDQMGNTIYYVWDFYKNRGVVEPKGIPKAARSC